MMMLMTSSDSLTDKPQTNTKNFEVRVALTGNPIAHFFSYMIIFLVKLWMRLFCSFILSHFIRFEVVSTIRYYTFGMSGDFIGLSVHFQLSYLWLS